METRFEISFFGPRTRRELEESVKTPEGTEPIYFFTIGRKRALLRNLYHFWYGFTGMKLIKSSE